MRKLANLARAALMPFRVVADFWWRLTDEWRVTVAMIVIIAGAALGLSTCTGCHFHLHVHAAQPETILEISDVEDTEREKDVSGDDGVRPFGFMLEPGVD